MEHNEDDVELPVEWSGYMNKNARENESTRKETKYVFGPLLDATPSHPDTVLTSIIFIEDFIKSYCQKYLYEVADLQLYKIILQIKWSDQARWSHLIVCPGRIYTLMSFLGCICVLMKATDLEEILGSAYSGVSSMLNGKA